MDPEKLAEVRGLLADLRRFLRHGNVRSEFHGAPKPDGPLYRGAVVALEGLERLLADGMPSK